jgi:DNA helicase-2/ATP-dependent DNA helicase PcrA
VSGAIDVIRRDDPPQVTLVDFKSGDPESDKHDKLDEEEMRLQVALYAVAAKKELEYQPEQGLVRYLDADDPAKSELRVPLNATALTDATKLVAATAARIRDREFKTGPAKTKGDGMRCSHCDFLGFCGMKQARDEKRGGADGW